MATEGPAVWDQGFLITDPAPVEGSHGGAPAHLALRSSLRLVPRVKALRFCRSRLGPPPRAVVSGASPCPQGIGRVWDQDLQLRYSVDGSPTCAPAHFSLPPVSSFSDGASVLCSCSSRPAVVPAFAAVILQQRRLTLCSCPSGVLSRVAVVGEGEFTVS